MGGTLRRAIDKSRSPISLAFLFGSYARGTDDATSDIDLMVIGEVSGRELANLLSSPRHALGREVNVVLMPPAEFREKVAGGSPFILDVLREPKIFLIAGEDELRELLGETERGNVRSRRGDLGDGSGRIVG